MRSCLDYHGLSLCGVRARGDLWKRKPHHNLICGDMGRRKKPRVSQPDFSLKRGWMVTEQRRDFLSQQLVLMASDFSPLIAGRSCLYFHPWQLLWMLHKKSFLICLVSPRIPFLGLIFLTITFLAPISFFFIPLQRRNVPLPRDRRQQLWGEPAQRGLAPLPGRWLHRPLFQPPRGGPSHCLHRSHQ